MTSNPRSTARSAARLAAVQALYQQEMERTPLNRLLDEFHQHRLGAEIEEVHFAEAETAFFDDIVKGAQDNISRSRKGVFAAVEDRLPASQDDMKALRDELIRIDRRLGEIERRLDELPHANDND